MKRKKLSWSRGHGGHEVPPLPPEAPRGLVGERIIVDSLPGGGTLGGHRGMPQVRGDEVVVEVV